MSESEPRARARRVWTAGRDPIRWVSWLSACRSAVPKISVGAALLYNIFFTGTNRPQGGGGAKAGRAGVTPCARVPAPPHPQPAELRERRVFESSLLYLTR